MTATAFQLVAPGVHPSAVQHRACSPTPAGACLQHKGRQSCAVLGCAVRQQNEAASTSGREDLDIEYKDSLTDIAFIALCRKAYGNLAGWQSERSWTQGNETFKGMVEVSKALMKGKTALQQQQAVIAGFPAVPEWFRRVFPYSKWGAELNARITPAFFAWLVGPMETIEVDVNGQAQQSGVHIKKCRYLAESGCVGMCTNLCKSPVQAFFTDQLGMPLTMKPNFDDLSCDMIFGLAPPHIAEDEVMQQSCFAECSQARLDSVPCHKLK